MKKNAYIVFILFLSGITFAQEKTAISKEKSSTSISNTAISQEKNHNSNSEKVDTVKTIVVPAFKSKGELDEYLNSKGLKNTVSPSK